MKRILTRLVGIALVVAGIAGLIFAVVAVIFLARVEPQVAEAVLQQIDLVDRALTATADGLVVVDDSLAQASGTVNTLKSVAAGVGQSMDATAPMIDTVAELLGDRLPATIASTQETLGSLSKTAGLIDGVLTGLDAIPFVNLADYQPDKPLSVGVLEVADSLQAIPASLEAAGEGLRVAGQSIGGLQGDIQDMADSIGQIEVSLASAREVMGQYQGVIGDLQRMVDGLQAGLPTWLRYLRLGISLILVWLGIAQFALITQGWELIGRSRKQAE